MATFCLIFCSFPDGYHLAPPIDIPGSNQYPWLVLSRGIYNLTPLSWAQRPFYHPGVSVFISNHRRQRISRSFTSQEVILSVLKWCRGRFNLMGCKIFRRRLENLHPLSCHQWHFFPLVYLFSKWVGASGVLLRKGLRD